VALALVAGAIHLVLWTRDLIPGETTTVPAFAAMGLGFLGCAAILALRRADLYVLVPVYALLLVFAYAVTRGQYPVEPLGLTSKAAEVGLALVTIVLMRRGDYTETGRSERSS
jgi:hypothetical protein